MNALPNLVGTLLGLGVEPKDLTFTQISLRGLVVLLFTLLMIRVGDRRSLSKKSAFDAALLIILASVLARAVNGSASFFPTLGACAVIVGLHRALAFFSVNSTWFRNLIKGVPQVLIRDGAYQHKEMWRNHIHVADVHEDMRLSAKTEQLSKIKIARLECSGDISFIETTS